MHGTREGQTTPAVGFREGMLTKANLEYHFGLTQIKYTVNILRTKQLKMLLVSLI